MKTGQDAEHETVTQCDQAFKTATRSFETAETELVAFRDAQQAYAMLKRLMVLLLVELTRRNFEISPQGS